jgi:predicted ATPase
MYDKLTISHFRAFEHLEVAPLHRVNLIAGGNNVGKTSLFEAVWFATQTDPTPGFASSLFRASAFTDPAASQISKDDTDNFWKWLFFRKDVSKPISISLHSSVTPNADRELTLPFDSISKRSTGGPFISHIKSDIGSGSPPPVCTTVTTFQPSPVEDADRVNDVSILNREDELAEYLRIVDPQICKLRYLKQSGHKYPYVYVDIFGKGKELIPATQLGQGIARMLELFSSLMTEGTQILLIDEFENGLQHDALVPIWSALGKFAREHDIQIFATTHSYECIAAAHEAFSGNADDFAVIKLRPDPALGIAAFVLDHEHVDVALKTEMEIR